MRQGGASAAQVANPKIASAAFGAFVIPDVHLIWNFICVCISLVGERPQRLLQFLDAVGGFFKMERIAKCCPGIFFAVRRRTNA